MPYEIEVEVLAMCKHLTDKECMTYDLEDKLNWKTPVKFPNPKRVFSNFVRVLDKFSCLTKASVETSCPLVRMSFSFNDVDPNNLMPMLASVIALDMANKSLSDDITKYDVADEVFFTAWSHTAMCVKVHNAESGETTWDYNWNGKKKCSLHLASTKGKMKKVPKLADFARHAKEQ